ncbi:HlyD family type I secretion periplasmic adaptor subunit [Kalamiella sp. sgz302252]|uniref:HlyD family type I secretion periplasmic adaptor subunit n=1 Tax=Pantoea sp. sgz302252 TaxID=3341827 RepID=UPI0036D25881
MSKDYREFLPAVLEIEETPPSPAGRFILWSIIILLTAVVIWAACGKVDIVAVTQGKVVVSELSRPVNAVVTAEVAEVLVREGMHVEPGQALIKLNGRYLEEQAAENRLRQCLNRFHIARLEKLVQHYRGQAVLAELPDSFLSEDKELATQILTKLRAEIENDRRAKEVYATRKTVLQAQLTNYEAQKKLATEQLPLFREQYQALQKLHERQLTSRDSLLEIRKKFLEASHTVETANAGIEEVRGNIANVDAEMRAGDASKISELLQQISERTEENRILASQLRQLASQIKHYTLRAPVAGTVESLLFRDTGGAVEPPQEMLKIVPDNGPLMAEVMVRNQDVGFLQPGQAVTVKISTFDFTRYGWVEGELQHVAADAIEDRDLGLVYRAVIALNKRTLLVEGQEKALEPGMQVTAEIKTGRRTILSYLLSPMLEALDGVGKQR